MCNPGYSSTTLLTNWMILLQYFEVTVVWGVCKIIACKREGLTITTGIVFKPKKTTRLSTHWVPTVNTKWKSSTLTILSHPADTMMGLLEFGENLTQDTHSVCPSSCWWTKDRSSLNVSIWGNVVLRGTVGHRVYCFDNPCLLLSS